MEENKNIASDNFTFPNDLPSYTPTEEEIKQMNEDAVKQTKELAKTFPSVAEAIDEETGEVTTIETKPTVRQNDNGTYQAFYLAPVNMTSRITKALDDMKASGDTELEQAMQITSKTIDGCIRYLNNTLADLGRQLKSKGLTAYDDNDIHYVARYYFVNPDCKDVQNVVNEVVKKKADKKKAEKPKAEKKSKVVPLTPQIGSLFGDDDF